MRAMWLLSLLGALTICGCRSTPPSPESLTVLRDQLEHGVEWKRVHAAEALGDAGCCREEVAAAFAAELTRTVPETPWRVGVLRVLAQADPARRDAIAAELWQIARNPAAEGRIHAIESIGKLRLPLAESDRGWLQELKDDPGMAGGYALLVLAQNEDPAALTALSARLAAGDVTAAFAFFYLDGLPPEALSALAKAADDQSASPVFRAFAFRALARAEREPSERHAELLRRIAAEQDAGALRFYLLTVGAFGDASDLPLLSGYLNHNDPALRIAAAGSSLTLAR